MDATEDAEAATTAATGETAGEDVLSAVDTGITGDTSAVDTLRSAVRS